MKRIALRFWYLGLALVALVAWPSVGHAQESVGSCDETVAYDRSCLEQPLDTAAVRQAAKSLADEGAIVRVRGVCDLGGYDSLDKWEVATEKSCGLWQGAEGGTRTNLIVLAVSFGTKREIGLYFGDRYRSALGPVWDRIQTDTIVPRLRDGDFAGAVAAGLKDVRDTVRNASATRVAGAGTVTVINEAPTDYSGLWIALAILAGLAFIALVIVFIVKWRRAAAARQLALQKAKHAIQVAASGVNSLDSDIALAKAKAKRAVADMPASEAVDVNDLATKMERAYDDASVEFSKLSESSEMNPDTPKLTTAQLELIEAAYNAVVKKFDGVRQTISALETAAAEALKRAAAAPGAVQQASEDIASSDARLQKIVDVGYRIDAAAIQTPSAQAKEELAAAQTALDAKKYREAIAAAERSRQAAATAAHQAEQLPIKKVEVDYGISAASERGQELEVELEKARVEFARLSEQYVEESWDTVRGNVEEADDRLDVAVDTIEPARKANGLDVQEFDEAAVLLLDIGRSLDAAETLIVSVIQLGHQLDAAKREAQPEIDTAQADIEKARDYERQHDDDVADGIKDDLWQAQQLLDSAREILASARPNYLTVLKMARLANQNADEILLRATGQHETLVRLRQRRDQIIAEAERSIDVAASYISNHRSDVDAAARNLIEEAKECLPEREFQVGGSDHDVEVLRQIIAQAERSDETADKALNQAKRDVREAEEARERARRRAAEAAAAAARAAAAAVAASQRRSHSSGFGGSSFGGSRGGGSSGWGGGGSRGGGSRSW